jgi:ABC-2 type transport system permease protein
MRPDRVLTITRRDLGEIRKNKMILLPMLFMPIIFAVVVPFSSIMGLSEATGADLAMLLYVLEAGMIPMFMALPAAIPSIIASYSFVGEKTEKTLEPLLATPTTDSELLLGKILSSFIPGILMTIIGFVLFVAITDVFTYDILGYLLLPNLAWILAVFVLAPLIALITITFTIILSSRMNDIREVQQVSVVIMLPFIFLFIGGVSGFVLFDILMLFAAIGILIAANILLFQLARNLFRREAILTKWK